MLSLRTDYVYAESKAEEEARLAKEEAEREAAQKAAAAADEESCRNPNPKDPNPMLLFRSEMAAEVLPVMQLLALHPSLLAIPYVYGGTSLTNGADCSGFVMSVYANFGIGLPHSSSALRSVGYGVSLC